jgi:hypothetical protein
MFDQNSSLFQHPRSGRKYDSVPVSRLAVFYTGVVFVTSDSNMFGLFRNFYYKNLQATGSLPVSFSDTARVHSSITLNVLGGKDFREDT